MLMDVDHFKRINDRYGHDCGDRVLEYIARRMDRHLRGGSLLARYGGEEFMVLAAVDGPLSAKAVAERLRQAVEASPVTVAGQAVGVTISIGVALWPAQNEFNAARQSADAALYRAKHAGRNRVEHAREPPTA